jgi:hypothetical protein
MNLTDARFNIMHVCGSTGRRTHLHSVMSSPHRFGREQEPAEVKRDRVLFLVFGLVAFGIAASLLFAHYGWIESIAP